MSNRIVRSVPIILAAAAVVIAAGMTLAAKPGGGGCPRPRPNCVCPMVYDPVVCDGGCTYSNACVARCAGATNCVSSGGGPVEVSTSTTDADAAAPRTADSSYDAACTLDFTPALETRGPAGLLDGLLAAEAAPRPCKPCKDRPWCTCTYNGMPRVSCNPCCYGHYGFPQVCFD